MKKSQLQELSFPEAIRKRPAMYVGGTALFGFIQYLVCPVSLLLANGAKRIDVTVGGGFEITSDAPIEIGQIDGRVMPFEELLSTGEGSRYEGVVLNALSQDLHVSVNTEARTEQLHFIKGRLASHDSQEEANALPGTTLRFNPDSSIFTIVQVPASIFESYFRRLSFLYGGVCFSLTVSGERQDFFAADGIAGLFRAISSPYQLMHEPIHIIGHEGRLTVELVMAYQSWKDNHLWCFINNGRAVEGGTHEQGLMKALDLLKEKLDLPEHFNNGIVAVASLRYPDAVWEGCIKARIGNPELKTMVSRLVVDEVVQWLDNHPAVAVHLTQLQTFQFPEAWYK